MKTHLFILLPILLFDQLTKYWVIHNHIPYLLNSGIAFSLPLANVVAFTISCIVIFWLYTYWLNLKLASHLQNIALGFIIGGAISNLIDRVHYGAVIDFIKIPYWPTFNIADACITVGVFLFIGTFSKQANNSQFPGLNSQ